MSHNRTVPSSPPQPTKVFPSALMATEKTRPSCPLNGSPWGLIFKSHNRTVPSSLPLTTVFPSRLNTKKMKTNLPLSSNNPFSDLLLVSRNQLTRLVYNPSRQLYDVSKTTHPLEQHDIAQFVVTDSHIFVSSKPRDFRVKTTTSVVVKLTKKFGKAKLPRISR